MGKLFLGMITTLLIILLAGAIMGQISREPSFYELEQQRIRLDTLQQQAEIEAFWAPVRAAALNTALIVAILGVAAGLTAWGVGQFVFFRQYARPDERGLLPVLRLDQDTAQRAIEAHHAAQIAAAKRAVPPAHLTYAPRIDYRTDRDGIFSDPAVNAPALPTPSIPTFGQLLDQGRVGRGQPMLLGYDDAGQPVEGSWLDLYSCGVGGLAGSGKSTTVAFLAAQAALFGTRIVMLDPHASNPESLAHRLAPLAGRFVCQPAERPAEQLAAVELVAEELRQRSQGKRGEPMLFVADEYSALQRGALAEPLARLVEGLGQEGRKLGLYGLVAGQVWTASRSGGSEVRDSLASAYVHRCRPAQARYLTGLTAADLPGDLLDLPPGTAYLLSTAGELRRVHIPHVDARDLVRVAGLDQGAAPSPSRPIGFRPEGASEGAFEGATPPPLRARPNAANLTPDEARIVAGFLGGKTVSDLAAELAGAKSGAAYQKAAAVVAAALRKALGQGVTK